MSASHRKGPSPALAVSIIALIVALGGTSYAALNGIPNAGGVFHGCVSKQTGVLRVVKNATQCRKGKHGEFAIAWNQKGLSGENGQSGARGDQGPTGSTGSTGQTGATGPAGTARAYGNVSASCTASLTSTCTLTGAKNATVTHPYEGIYCISVSGVSPTETGVIATLENNKKAQIAYVSSVSCPQSTFEIQILSSGGGNTDEPFFFVVP